LLGHTQTQHSSDLLPARLDTLASYVPARIVRRIVEDAALPTNPIADQFEAAVFFADISGFTQMAERLGQSGPSGGLFHYHWA
jgi:class 3 adenylate cyclase